MLADPSEMGKKPKQCNIKTKQSHSSFTVKKNFLDTVFSNLDHKIPAILNTAKTGKKRILEIYNSPFSGILYQMFVTVVQKIF